MTNLHSIAGGTLWMLLSVLLVFVALEPVSVAEAAPVRVASASAPGGAA